MAFEKHVNQKDNFSFEFDKVLQEGETLSNPSIEIVKRTDDNGTVSWEDKTSEFGSINPSVNGKDVVFTLNDRQSSDEQDESPYLVYCEVNTSTNRILVDTNYLIVDTAAEE